MTEIFLIKLLHVNHIEMYQSPSVQNLTSQTASSSSQSQIVGFLQEMDGSGEVVNSMSAVLPVDMIKASNSPKR